MSERATDFRVNVLGVGISAINLTQATGLILEGIRRGQTGYIAVTGVHGVTEAQDDPEFRRILNEAWMVTPDGMPMTWVGRLQGYREMNRVYGPDLMAALFEATRDGSVRHFFYGGDDGVAEKLKLEMERKFPGVEICGTYTPPFRPLSGEEERNLKDLVEARAPHVIWIGLGTPKQERFMAAHPQLATNFMVGVGAAFDMHSGRKQQAPFWMQRSGLEWFYRLCQEPRRLGRRYAINNPLFVFRIVMQLLGLRRHKLERA